MAEMEEAIQTTIRGLDGKLKSAYFDTKGNAILNPEDYYISDYDNPEYWSLETATAGDVTAAEKTKQVPDQKTRAELVEQRGGNDAAGTVSDGYDPNASNNFGWTPDNVVSKYASKMPGPIGTFGRMAKTAQNLSNLGSKNLARQALGLDPLTSNKDIAKAALKGADDIADIQIGDKQYSVGFNALDKQTNATTLTTQEAIDRARRQGYAIKEIDKRQQKIDGTKASVSKAKGRITAALEKMGIKSPELGKRTKEALAPSKKKEESVPTPTAKPNLSSPIEKVTGIEKGWAKRALDKVVGKTPTETKKKEDIATTVPTPTPRDTVTTTPDRAKELSQKQGTEETTTGTGISPSLSGSFGFAGGLSRTSPSIPGQDRLGRVSLASVDIDKLGLQPDVAAKFKDFQQAAVAQGLDLSVDVANAVRSPEQQADIVSAGNSWTKNSFHEVGFALDVSPTAVNSKGQITDQKTLEKARALAKEKGFGLLNAAKDPAHMQVDVLGGAKGLKTRSRDPFGRVELSPEEALAVRDETVPTPFGPFDPQAQPTRKDITDIGLNTPLGPDFAQERELDKSLDPMSPVGPDETVAEMNDLDTLSANAEDVMASLAPSVADRIKDVSSFSSLSPAQAASLGLANRTEEDIDAIAETLAGELSPESLSNIDSPDVRSEIANMVASVENRAASKQFGTLQAALTPSQYNSLSPANQAVTQNNFSKFGTALKATIADFYTGKLSPTSPTITNYANLDISKPSWAGKMTDVSKVGPHTFGTLTEDVSPNLGYSQSFKDKMASLDKAKAATGAVATSANAVSNVAQTTPNTTQASPAQAAPTSDAGRGTTSDRQNQAGSTKDGPDPSSGKSESSTGDRGGNNNGGVGSGLGSSTSSTGGGFGSGSFGSPSVGGSTPSTSSPSASSGSKNGFGSDKERI